jgi:hypothetical protein
MSAPECSASSDIFAFKTRTPHGSEQQKMAAQSGGALHGI